LKRFQSSYQLVNFSSF